MSGINQFKGSFLDLARPNRFEVSASVLGTGLRFLAKAASLHGATLGVMETPYMGRMVKIAGDRVYADWDVTVYQDDRGTVRKAVEEWQKVALSHEQNIGAAAHLQYKEDVTVRQLNRQDSVIQEYKLIGCFPTEIGLLDMAWDSNDTPAEFTITLAYDYYETEGGSALGTAIGIGRSVLGV
jgi:hypothetical protein